MRARAGVDCGLPSDREFDEVQRVLEYGSYETRSRSQLFISTKYTQLT